MSINLRMIVFLATIIFSISHSSAWWWGGGSSRSDQIQTEPLSQWPPTPIYYQQRVIAAQPQQSYPGNEPPVPMSVPAIPIQVPLRAQFAPVPNIHNVQLVPCLCPAKQEEPLKPIESGHTNNKEVN